MNVMKLDRSAGTSSNRQQIVVSAVRHSSFTQHHMALIDDRCSSHPYSSSRRYLCLHSNSSFPGHLWACPHSSQSHRTFSLNSTLGRNRTHSSALRLVSSTSWLPSKAKITLANFAKVKKFPLAKSIFL